MPKMKRPVSPMGPGFGKMKINHTHDFIMQKAREVGNIPKMRIAKPPSKVPNIGRATATPAKIKLAPGGPANLRVPGKRISSESVRVLPSTKAKMTQNKVKIIAKSPEAMSKGSYKQRTIGEQEFGQYLSGTGKRGVLGSGM